MDGLGGAMTATGVTRVRADSVSPGDRLGWWSSMVADAVMPVAISCDRADRFEGRAISLQLAHTEVSTFSFSPMSARRTRTHIRRGDPESYFLVLVHGSPIGLEQRRNTTLLQAGDMALFDTWDPLACEFQDQGRQCRLTLVRLPRAAMPLPHERTNALLSTRLPTRAGTGALLVSYLAGLRANAAHCDEAELLRLGAVGFHLVSDFLATRLDGASTLSAEARRQVLLTRVLAHIDHYLADPELGPVTIAAHHHISVRLLHQLFRQQPETVGATIRRRRLERSRADLADPRLCRRTVGEIGLRWGFRHPADFSRAFRAAYGVPPGEYRRTASVLDAQPPPW
ncbi:helix-turn-helix domain-containing protein [Streptomyces sp. NPDC005963]|uniref:AraC-like ligand-binding domain-containing protein n=1 Tax=Streptomyces sp. NPDC005963 TaxID=3156721 RepID=UPI0033DEFF97